MCFTFISEVSESSCLALKPHGFMRSSICPGQNHCTFLCFLISAFLRWCPWLMPSPPGAMQCLPTLPAPESSRHSALLYLLGTLQIDFGKQMDYKLQICHFVLISGSANSSNFADCKCLRKWQPKEQECQSCIHCDKYI